jgi:ABC-type antimicrobial peptide transport system permease subunit
MVVGEAMTLAGTGVGIGLLMAAWLGGLVRGLLFDVAPADPASLAAGAVALVAAALLAAWVPARRALAVEPAAVLRGD